MARRDWRSRISWGVWWVGLGYEVGGFDGLDGFSGWSCEWNALLRVSRRTALYQDREDDPL